MNKLTSLLAQVISYKVCFLKLTSQLCEAAVGEACACLLKVNVQTQQTNVVFLDMPLLNQNKYIHCRFKNQVSIFHKTITSPEKTCPTYHQKRYLVKLKWKLFTILGKILLNVVENTKYPSLLLNRQIQQNYV